MTALFIFHDFKHHHHRHILNGMTIFHHHQPGDHNKKTKEEFFSPPPWSPGTKSQFATNDLCWHIWVPVILIPLYFSLGEMLKKNTCWKILAEKNTCWKKYLLKKILTRFVMSRSRVDRVPNSELKKMINFLMEA